MYLYMYVSEIFLVNFYLAVVKAHQQIAGLIPHSCFCRGGGWGWGVEKGDRKGGIMMMSACTGWTSWRWHF